MKPTAGLLAAVAIAGMVMMMVAACHRDAQAAPPAVSKGSVSVAPDAGQPPDTSAAAIATKPWFVCRSADTAADYIATAPDVDQTFTLQVRERATGKVVAEYALTAGEADAGAGNVFMPLQKEGRAFGALRSVNGGMLDPPVDGTVPRELRLGNTVVQCEDPPAASPQLSASAIVGVWSFDGSCASGDGMILAADGSASFDEGGEGHWRLTDNRLVLELQVREMGDENATPERFDYALQVTRLDADHLAGTLTEQHDRQPPRTIDARRCVDTDGPGAATAQ
jgi:hypothetical protein